MRERGKERTRECRRASAAFWPPRFPKANFINVMAAAESPPVSLFSFFGRFVCRRGAGGRFFSAASSAFPRPWVSSFLGHKFHKWPTFSALFSHFCGPIFLKAEKKNVFVNNKVFRFAVMFSLILAVFREVPLLGGELLFCIWLIGGNQ